MSYEERLKEYEKKKERIRKEFSEKSKDSKRVGLEKTTSNLFRHQKKNKSTIDVLDLNKVINVDQKNLTAEVEGMTTYEELVRGTLPYGVMPTVVPQLKSITLGGAVTGVGIESSSFKYGLVHETITEMEILLGDGSIALCTPDNEHRDLFFGFPNSYGTFGYALKLKVKTVPVKKYVKLTHLKFTNAKAYFENLEVLCQKKDSIDFIDGTVFNDREMYITIGQFTNEAPFVSNYKYMRIYYKSIKEKKVDYLTISDYIWRWDTDWFWCSSHFGLQNPVVRFLVGKWALKSTFYWKLRAWDGKYRILENIGKATGAGKRESVVQDIEIPIENCEKFITWFHKAIGIKPVWICPIKKYDPSVTYDLFKMEPSALYVNFGFWDSVATRSEDGYYNRLIERKVRELGGKKSLYSTSYYSKEEFWELYNKEAYKKLKEKYDPGHAFEDLYSECVKIKK